MAGSLAIILAAVWGGIWAALLQHTAWGAYLARRRAWLAVVIGVGVDLLILLAVLDPDAWLRTCAIIGASAAGIIIRSIANEWREHREIMEAVRGNTDPDR